MRMVEVYVNCKLGAFAQVLSLRRHLGQAWPRGDVSLFNWILIELCSSLQQAIWVMHLYMKRRRAREKLQETDLSQREMVYAYAIARPLYFSVKARHDIHTDLISVSLFPSGSISGIYFDLIWWRSQTTQKHTDVHTHFDILTRFLSP